MQDNNKDRDEYNADIAPNDGADVSDDDLDLSELLEKYMLEPQDASEKEKEDESIAEAVETVAEEDDDIADEIDQSVYSEYASEVYSDDDARRAASDDAAVLDEFETELEKERTGVYEADETVAQTLDAFDPNADYSYEDGVYGDDEDETEDDYVDDGEAELSGEPVEDDLDDTDGLYVDGSEYADDLADLSAFAEGDELAPAEAYAADAAYGDAELSEDEAPEDEAVEEEEAAEDFVDYEAQDEQLDIDENVDSTDINLMLAFGLEDELENTLGAENAQRLTKELDEEQRKRDEHVRKLVDNEYMNRSQTAGIANDYKKRYLSVRIRLALAALLSIGLFFYENLRLFKLEFSGAFDATVYPTVYIMGSLQLLLLVAACAYDQLLAGFVRIFKGSPDHRSVTSIAVTMAVIYSAVLPSVTTIAHKPLVVNFAVALIILFTLISEFYNVRREIFSFNVVSSKKPKHVITKDDITDSGFDSSDGDVLKFETAAFVDSFFTRTKEPVKSSKTYAVAALVISLVSAALAGIVTKLVGSGAVLVGSVVENSFCGFFIALPVSMMIAASYPFYRAARSAYDIDGAIIGETSLEEYSDASCVTFDDIGVFPSYGVRVQNIKIYNNHRIDRVLYYAASVFSVARGPLTDVFDMATVEIGHSDEVKIRAAGSGYLSAAVDDKSITFGSAAELITRGFDIPENVTDEDDFDDEDVSVMYMFREEKLMAKLFIKYSLDADFETIMASLCEEGISVSIKTYDPNIDHDLISSGLTKKGEYSFSVTRYDGADDGSTVRDNADSGIVSRSSAKTLLQLISDCTKVLASRKSATVIGIISAVVAAILLLVVIATGNASALLAGRVSAIIAIYQVFWMIPVYISAKMQVR